MDVQTERKALEERQVQLLRKLNNVFGNPDKERSLSRELAEVEDALARLAEEAPPPLPEADPDAKRVQVARLLDEARATGAYYPAKKALKAMGPEDALALYGLYELTAAKYRNDRDRESVDYLFRSAGLGEPEAVKQLAVFYLNTAIYTARGINPPGPMESLALRDWKDLAPAQLRARSWDAFLGHLRRGLKCSAAPALVELCLFLLEEAAHAEAAAPEAGPMPYVDGEDPRSREAWFHTIQKCELARLCLEEADREQLDPEGLALLDRMREDLDAWQEDYRQAVAKDLLF